MAPAGAFVGAALLGPSRLVCVSSSALIAITAKLPEIESAAISGDSMKG